MHACTCIYVVCTVLMCVCVVCVLGVYWVCVGYLLWECSCMCWVYVGVGFMCVVCGVGVMCGMCVSVRVCLWCKVIDP